MLCNKASATVSAIYPCLARLEALIRQADCNGRRCRLMAPVQRQRERYLH
jgi:hypothetical protein